MPTPIREDLAALSARIREAVKAVGTQLDAATRVGVSLPQMQRYVSGRSEPPRKVIEALATASGYRIVWLLTGEGPKLFSEELSMAREQAQDLDREERAQRIRIGEVRQVVLERVAWVCDVGSLEHDPNDADWQRLVDDTAAIVSMQPASIRPAVLEAVIDAQVAALGYASIVRARRMRISLLTRRPSYDSHE